MARAYKRDANGRFAGGGGGGARPRSTGGTLGARASLQRSRAKLATNRSSAQRGAVTRGSRKLAAVKAESRRKLPAANRPAGTMQGKVQRRPAQAVTPTTVMPRQQPRQPGQGAMTQALRSTLRTLARLDAQRIRDIESLTGAPIGKPRSSRGGSSRAIAPGAGKPPAVSSGKPAGRASDSLRGALRNLAQSDARHYRDLGSMTAGASRGQLKGTGGGKRVSGGSGKALPGGGKPKGGRKKR
jgi:hypothetical protein